MAVFECIAFYVFYGVGYGDRGKTEATTESIKTNTCYRIRDCDWGQVAATIECIVSYACYRVGYGDRGKTGAVIVFANAFISNTCVLNGRKV